MAASVVALGPGAASADDGDPARDTVDGVTSKVQQRAQPGSAPPVGSVTAEQSGPAGKSTKRPATHATSQVLEADLAGNDVLDVARSEASIEDDDSSRADATLLALGGQEIIGTHADSTGEKETHAGDPFWAVCEGSEGQLCLRVLYADAYADGDQTGSSSLSRTGLADICLDGKSADRRARCAGPAHVGVGTSEARTHRDKETGRTESRSESALLDACLGQEEDMSCAIGVSVLKAWTAASSDDRTEKGSTVVSVELGNKERGSFSDEEHLDLPPGCPDAESAACVALNQGQSRAAAAGASAAQEALNAAVLPGNLDAVVGVSSAESSATQGEAAVVKGAPRADAAPSGDDSSESDDSAGVLPDTGGVWSGLLAVALAAVGAGSFLVARGRRRVGATT